MAELPQPNARMAETRPAWQQARWLNFALTMAELSSIAALFAFRFWHSWLRWGDPLIDFPRSLYAAWRLSLGDMLYVNVVSEYGPLAHLVQAAGFRIFGVGLDTMIWMNTVVAVLVVLLLRAIFRALGSRLMGWLAPVVFISVFAFENYYLVSNYNFIAPYAAQATYGFAGLLLVLWSLLRYLKSERSGWLMAAGVGLAVAYLNKPDLLLAAVGALGLFLLAQTLWRVRTGSRASGGRWLGKTALWLAAGFLCLWLPVFLFFLAQGGWSYALYAADHVVYTVTSDTVMNNVARSPLMLQIFGFIDPWGNLEDEINAACFLVIPCLIIASAAQQWTRERAVNRGWLMSLAVAVAPVAIILWTLPRQDIWLDSGEAFALPVFLATAGYAGWCLWAAWKRGAEFKRVTGLAVLGVAASLMLVRMILNVRLVHFGFFMMPLAVLFWTHLMVVEAARPALRSVRRNWLLPAVCSASILLVGAGLAQDSMDNYQLKTYEVGTGRDRFYTYPPSVYPEGWLLKTMIEGAKIVVPNAKLVAVLPGGFAVNYFLRVPSPLSHLEVFPIAISRAAAQRALNELKVQPPDLVMLYARDLSENGAYYFGSTRASGLDILLWLRDHYKVVGFAGKSTYSITRHGVDFLVPNTVAKPPPQRVHVDAP